MNQPVVAHIASLLTAIENCAARDNKEWQARHLATLNDIEQELPSGSGFDSGTTIDRERSNADKIILHTSFHHMDEHGGYDGWTEHKIIVTPAFNGVNIKITGPNRNNIKEYMHEVFHQALMTEVK